VSPGEPVKRKWRPYYKLLNLDYFTMIREQLEERRIKVKEESRVRAEERKKYHGGDK
jgi:hypothetical protein